MREREIDDQFVANPTIEQMYSSTLDLIYVGNAKDMLMIEGSADQISEEVQLKLSELILKIDEAENRFATAEDMSEEQLEELHAELRQQAEDALGQLNTRRAAREKKAS